jgi:hypothetical protein
MQTITMIITKLRIPLNGFLFDLTESAMFLSNGTKTWAGGLVGSGWLAERYFGGTSTIVPQY